MITKKSSKFGLGLLLGTVIGGITALFLSPNTGEENREIVAKKIQDLKTLMEEKEVDKKVKEIFGEVTEEAKNLYMKAKEELIEALARLKESIENIDKEKYMSVVEDVMKKVQKETNREVKQLEKLKNHLLEEWNKLRP